MTYDFGQSNSVQRRGLATCVFVMLPKCHSRSLSAVARTSALLSRVLTEEAHAVTFVKHVMPKENVLVRPLGQEYDRLEDAYDNIGDGRLMSELVLEEDADNICEVLGFSLANPSFQQADALDLRREDFSKFNECKHNESDARYLSELLISPKHVSAGTADNSCFCKTPSGNYQVVHF